MTTAGEVSEARAAKYRVRGVSFIVKPSRQELIEIKELIDGGIIQPIVSAVFPLAQAHQAFERGIGGHTRGSWSSPFNRDRSERDCASRQGSKLG